MVDLFDELDSAGREETPGGEVAPPAIELRGTMWPANDRPHEGKLWRLGWSKLAERIDSPRPMPEGGKQALPVWNLAVFRNMMEHEARARAEASNEPWRAQHFGAPYRDLEHFVCAYGVVLDYDSLTDDEVFKREQKAGRPVDPGNRTLSSADLRRCWGRWCYLAHTSPSHRPGLARWRVLLPFDGLVRDPEVYRRVCEWVVRYAARHGAPGVDLDRAWMQPAQAFKVPAATEHYQADCNRAGNPLDVAEILAELDAWEAEAGEAPAEAEGPPDHLTPIFAPLGDTWLTEPPPPRPMLLRAGPEAFSRAFLPSGKVCMLAAAGGTGKTQSLIQLAISVATGIPWLDTFGVTGPGHVVLALGEEDEAEMRRRIFYVARELKLSPEQRALAQARIFALPLSGQSVVLVRPVQRKGPEGTFTEYLETPAAVKLRELLDGAGVEWRCIILDPASRFMGQDTETDNAAATRFIEVLERFTKVPGGPAVLFAHHTSKAGLMGVTDQGSARGSSALTDGCRWQANLERVHAAAAYGKPGKLRSDRTCLRLVKSNYAAYPDQPLQLTRVTDGVLRPTPLDQITHEREEDEAARKPAGKPTQTRLPKGRRDLDEDEDDAAGRHA